jgi:hypothetical protein
MVAGCVGVAYTEPGPGVYYGYDYYPDLDVYYYPERHVYYWNEGGAWRSGSSLPSGYHIRGEHHEYYRLHTQQPWTQHHEERGGHGNFDHHDHD